MAYQAAAAAGIGAALGAVIAAEVGRIVVRGISAAFSLTLVEKLLSDLGEPKNVLKNVVPRWAEEKFWREWEESEKLRGIEQFLRFLIDFNKRFARLSVYSGILGSDFSFAVSQIANAYQWSYGLGWLSWIGTGQVLQNLVAQPAEQELNRILRHKLLTESAAKELWALGLISDEELYEHLARLGYSDERIKAIKKALIDDLTTGKVARLVNLGIVSKEDVVDKLEKLGVDRELAEKAVRKMFKLPSESMIIKLYHSGKLPREDAVKLLVLHGYDEKTANLVIDSISVEKAEALMKEAWILGFADDKAIEDYLKALGYSEEKIKLLKKAFADDLTSGKVAKLLRIGIIKEQDVVNRLVNLGIPRDLAELAVKRMYNLPSDSVIIKLYKARRLEKEPAIRMLMLNGYDRESAELVLEAATLERTEDDRTLSKSDVMQLRRHGIIDDSTFIQFMKALGYDEIEADYLLKLVKATIPVKDAPKPRSLSKENIVRAYILDVLKESEARNLLAKLGYDEGSINVIIEVANKTKEKQAKVEKMKIAKSDVLRALRLEVISESDARALLSRLGFKDEEISLLLRIEDVEEEERARRRFLTVSQLGAAFRAKLIDEFTFESYLRNLGYGNFEVRILKALYSPRAS